MWKDFVTFQATWWLALGSALGYGWWLPIPGILAQLFVHYRFHGHKRFIRVVVASLLCALVAFLIDLWMQRLNILQFKQPIYWLMAMWIGFVLTWTWSMKWFCDQKWAMRFSIAALGFPIAYWPGQKLGALVFTAPSLQSLLVFGAIWGVAWPILTEVHKRWVR